jgi:serine/threonine-protein kinase
MGVPSSQEWPGARRIGRYVLYDVIAAGGMASVCLARLQGAVGFSRIVAVKCIHPHIAREPDFVAMFLDEARLASRIRHANVVAPLDVVADGADLFLVLEYVAGESLARLLEACRAAHEPVPLEVALRVASDMLHGLGAAHGARDEQGQLLGLVHRDVSPHNVLVGSDGVARVADFGVAKAAGRLQTTRSGQLKGKLGYMAPEQLRGLPVSPRSDLYSAAVTLWELLAGRRMFTADNEAELVLQAVAGAVPPLAELRPELPRALGEVLARALHPDARQRPEDAAAFAEALEAAGPLASAREVSRWVERWAGESLAARAALVQRIEQQAGLPPSQPPPRRVGAAPGSGRDSEGTHDVALEPRRAEGTPLGLARSSQAVAAAGAGARRQQWLAGAGVLILLGASAAVFVSLRAAPTRGSGEGVEAALRGPGGEERAPGVEPAPEVVSGELIAPPTQVAAATSAGHPDSTPTQEAMSEHATPEPARTAPRSPEPARTALPGRPVPSPARTSPPAVPSVSPQAPTPVPDDLLGRR